MEAKDANYQPASSSADGSATEHHCSTDANTPGFENDEDYTSNVAVGVASPEMHTQSPNDRGIDESWANRSAIAQDEIESPSHNHPEPTPRQVALNESNLLSFENAMLKGKVPLRADLVNRSFADPSAELNIHAQSPLHDSEYDRRSAAAAKSLSLFTNYPTQSELADDALRTMASVSAGTLDQSSPVRQRSVADNLTSADKLSVFSVDGSVGSQHRLVEDVLNEENLERHEQEMRGANGPLPLKSENIAVTHHRSAQDGGASSRREMDVSVAVEPSETEATVASPPHAGVSENRRQNSVSHARCGAEDTWSTASTGVPGENVVGNDGHYQNLSRASLYQLRQQIESGGASLRPELLAELSGVTNRRTSPIKTRTLSRSLAVGVPDESNPFSGCNTAISSVGDYHTSSPRSNEYSRGAHPRGDRRQLDEVSNSAHGNLTDAIATDASEANTASNAHRAASHQSSVNLVTEDGAPSVDMNEKSITSLSREAQAAESAVIGDDVGEVADTREIGRLKKAIMDLYKVTYDAQQERCQVLLQLNEINQKVDRLDSRVSETTKSDNPDAVGLIESRARAHAASVAGPQQNQMHELRSYIENCVEAMQQQLMKEFQNISQNINQRLEHIESTLNRVQSSRSLQ